MFPYRSISCQGFIPWLDKNLGMLHRGIMAKIYLIHPWNQLDSPSCDAISTVHRPRALRLLTATRKSRWRQAIQWHSSKQVDWPEAPTEKEWEKQVAGEQWCIPDGFDLNRDRVGMHGFSDAQNPCPLALVLTWLWIERWKFLNHESRTCITGILWQSSSYDSSWR